MAPVTYSELRENLKESMDKVCDSHEPLIVTRRGAEPVVLISLEDYESIMETLHLMRSPQNAERIIAAKKRLDAGLGISVNL
jgi:antitoxin YefM